MMARSKSPPPNRIVLLITVPPNEIIPMSAVPSPISITIDPRASKIGKPEPIAAATGRSIRKTSRAPAWITASIMARCSTSVMPQGTPTSTRDLRNELDTL